MAGSIAQIILRGLQFLWTLLIMALIGNVIADASGHDPAVINYSMFTAAFSMLSLFYLVPISFNDGFQGHAIIPLTLDVLNTIFFFCGGIAMAAELHARSCTNYAYLISNKLTNGSADMTKRCRENQASTAFLWFGFACYFASMVLSIFGAKGSGANMRVGGIRRGPAMTQRSPA